ncbi:TrkH family potassium uptake protein [Phaeovulum vinaykumarii]|uniref:Trk system potassium uptake protein TrkH n=1 Tax=Phaeovulum vinaykumarii TaxID=407234 RepID=A0A1N7JJ17_9RHOB|nr:potassium transporter TrkG [Phaeovulum vinaykumarii]SIS49246.1 trk system potassium uptake protein TrkH [Phaeovulum vinaykumarii]SOB89500.1 trk system potassium uptake protein TrkH [Phaeovulum vinaykumarii]
MEALSRIPLFVILMGLGTAAMFVPAAHALTQDAHAIARPFFYAGILFSVLTTLIGLATASGRIGHSARGQLMTLLATFTALPLMLAVPFSEALPDTGLYNAWWEMVSALTTTGATLYPPERLAPTLHLWRALVGWMGGFFVLVTALAVLAPMRLGGFEVFVSGGATGAALEVTRPRAPRHAPPSERILRYGMTLFPAYAGLTFALWVALLIAGDPSLVALCHAMATLSTSGISPIAGPAEAPSGVIGEGLIFVMLLPAFSRRFWPGGIEFRASDRLVKDPEIQLALGLILIVPLVFFFRHWLGALEVAQGVDLHMAVTSLWGGMFTVASFLASAGFESSGWIEARDWSGLAAPGLILAGLAITGGGIATTAGGVKLLRVYTLVRHGERELERLVHPSSVAGGGPIARRLRRQGAYISWIFFMLFAMSIAVATMGVSFSGLGFEHSVLLSIAALSNTGPLAGISGLAPLPWWELGGDAKAILAGAMVLGRLETLAIIALFNPELWRP